MSAAKQTIAALGAGRMGRGIAIVFAYAGHPVALIDFKTRPEADFTALAAEARQEIHQTLTMLHELGMFADAGAIPRILDQIQIVPKSGAAEALAEADVIFEGFPEILDLKREALREASALCRDDAIIASTTSTILVDDLSTAVRNTGRFLNAHWLNPAFIVPLVELSPGRDTSDEATRRMTELLESVGKVPVTCAARPGFIVPRMQTVAMNEAARLVEEGVASVEDIEKAAKYGFGFRFSVLGLLEFIDWGGGDILHHASRYLSDAMQDDRYAAPEVVTRNMEEGRIGLKTGAGFLDYSSMDVPAYRKARLGAFVERLRDMGMATEPAA
ncbi:3-hydroxybutyryl-CoA dehydrogenase [Paracoccus ravus]|uniref:3-hydroxybutyryl-CoA dehydrogenase n=1 Tax=Paracoccus ravus TaxID=2447760 RepID=UPI00106E8B45|nr:3-hydroxybutyryl-CoA dehydrogenase [Paracoccus ravus]